MTEIDDERARYLAALEELRQERDELHPRRPLLDHLRLVTDAPGPRSAGGPHRAMTDTADPAMVDRVERRGRYLTDEERERGLRRVAELRALLHRESDGAA